MTKLGHLISELRRRKVLGVAAGYAVIAWGILQIAGTVLQMAEAPGWVAKLVLVLAAAGFPVAILLAWFFDLSTTGFVRTPPEVGTDSTTHVPVLLAVVAMVVIGVATGFAVWLRPGTSREIQFTQLTNFADAATAPALSPDGRSLAFLKGQGFFGNSAAPAQLFVMQLPAGEPVQLTHSQTGKATPTFSPDGSRIAFTSATGNFAWATNTVSINGGAETELLPNASGLQWLDNEHVVFSEIRYGVHMGLRRSTVSRGDVQDAYFPANEAIMVHRSAISPDRKWLIAVEMEAGAWRPCQLVALQGKRESRQVGPPDAQCTYAAWSPDGRWMYFSSNAGGGTFHIWRQRFPDGEPKQLTHGPTEEEGLAIAPDGKSLITSAGVRRNAIGLYDGDDTRAISVEAYAFAAVPTHDGKRVYYLKRSGASGREYNAGKLVVAAPDSGTREDVLPGFTMLHFDLSADDHQVVFASADADPERRGIWLAPLDRRAGPRRIYAGATENVFLDPAGNVYFVMSEGKQRFAHRLRAPDYTINERVNPEPVWHIFTITPDGEWLALLRPRKDNMGMETVVVSTSGLPTRMICSFCGNGGGPMRMIFQPLAWTRDGRTMFVAARTVTRTPMSAGPQYTVTIPVRPGAALPPLPAGGVQSIEDFLKVPGAEKIAKVNVIPGATKDQLYFYDATAIRNLYRVQLPH